MEGEANVSQLRPQSLGLPRMTLKGMTRERQGRTACERDNKANRIFSQLDRTEGCRRDQPLGQPENSGLGG